MWAVEWAPTAGLGWLLTAQASLAAFVGDIDTPRTPPPEFRAIVTADGPTMPLPEGAVTFPLRALRP